MAGWITGVITGRELHRDTYHNSGGFRLHLSLKKEEYPQKNRQVSMGSQHLF